MSVRVHQVDTIRPRRRQSRAAIQYGCAWLVWVVVFSGLVAGEAEQPPSSGPRLEFEATEVDLGTIDRGEIANARFAVRNAGDRPLRLLRVKPG